ncbi:hypothetical protein CDV26_02435 [Francisella halioticida]|uniref:SAM-dependent methyltransferase n=1 Tax=Francisella halioticida TaxID=549298 RepID=A0ABN5B0Z0_9GAMM|nr:hypothetical protein [Francisella halioticida]ASG67405.1 hypothetical protein CDV26_02435 [Francisella halioticida]
MISNKIPDDFFEHLNISPRVGSLSKHFADIASGEIQKPKRLVRPNKEYLKKNHSLNLIYTKLKGRLGVFNEHFYSSCPYALENCIRLIDAIYIYQQKKSINGNNFSFYEPGGGCGDLSRILSEISFNRIASLCTSSTKENQVEFDKYVNSHKAIFKNIPYYEITKKRILSDKDLKIFTGGFNVIYERNVFQMYNPDRINQIKILTNVLQEDGIIILEEKLKQCNSDDYDHREQIKDHLFKSQYYDINQIAIKKNNT